MRLTGEQIAASKAAAVEAFGSDVVVRLFGSRVDDQLQGGDIDIHIVAAPGKADVDHEVKFRALVWKALDEEQIDVVVTSSDAEPLWIDRANEREGMIL